MPLSDDTLRILELCRDKEYNPGTYRTDFVLTGDNKINLIEITCRFALNGFLRSDFVNKCGIPYAERYGITREDRFSSFIDDIENFLSSRETIVLLKDDRFNEGRHFKAIIESAGKKVVTLSMEEMPENNELISNSACITQMRHDEIYTLPAETLKAIIGSVHLNDFRTVFLVHDKRFFALLYDDDFREKALGKEDADRLKTFLTPTYTQLSRPDLWQRLHIEKDKWIIKPTVLGMGLGISAGVAVSESDWQQALEKYANTDAVFQPYLPQNRFSWSIGPEQRENDYIAGTLLFFQDEYYGPGSFRVSSHPVTNQGDDRKIASVILKSDAQDAAFYSRERGWIV